MKSKAYYESGLLRYELQEVVRRHGNDSPEADEVRDRMIDPWRAMSEAEQKEIRDLSAALNESHSFS